MTEHFISLNLKFAARAPILDNEDSDFIKIKIAKSSQNRLIFYNCTRSFGFNLKTYRMTS